MCLHIFVIIVLTAVLTKCIPRVPLPGRNFPALRKGFGTWEGFWCCCSKEKICPSFKVLFMFAFSFLLRCVKNWPFPQLYCCFLPFNTPFRLTTDIPLPLSVFHISPPIPQITFPVKSIDVSAHSLASCWQQQHAAAQLTYLLQPPLPLPSAGNSFCHIT